MDGYLFCGILVNRALQAGHRRPFPDGRSSGCHDSLCMPVHCKLREHLGPAFLVREALVYHAKVGSTDALPGESPRPCTRHAIVPCLVRSQHVLIGLVISCWRSSRLP